MSLANCIHPLNAAASAAERPARFTWPFYYQPHPLCEVAMAECQQWLETRPGWGEDDRAEGLMFGVLVVETPQGDLACLRGYAGTIEGVDTEAQGFVPSPAQPAPQLPALIQQRAQCSAQLEQAEADPQLAERQAALDSCLVEQEQALAQMREQMTRNRQLRKARRVALQSGSDPDEYSRCMNELASESVRDKLQLNALKLHWQAQVSAATAACEALTTPLAALRRQHEEQLRAVEQAQWGRYRFLNARGEYAGLAELFADTPRQFPPEGAGESVEPKLLQFAYVHGLRPLAMAAFWWGASPAGEVRHHRRVYPASLGRSKPVLTHMLAGLTVEDDPLRINPAAELPLPVIYQDDDLLVVNKPAGMLSVPGKHIQDSVATRMEQQFPAAKGHLIVHRLDMATSGLMVIALSKKAHKRLQRQFIEQQVEKRYEALLAGELTELQGEISLPLRGDYDDLPRQRVCHRWGKPARTLWQRIALEAGRSRVYLYPKTGRTHQLRMHCAHQAGLAMPIVGDQLYGHPERRLHLHAGQLRLTHPISGESMLFSADAAF